MSKNYSYTDTPTHDEDNLHFDPAPIMSANPSSTSTNMPIQNNDIETSIPIVSKRKRSRSTKACITCHNKKIKCDLAQKQHDEKCSNCENSKCNCELYVRKKRRANKRSATLITIDQTPSTGDSYQNKPSLTSISSIANSIHYNSLQLKKDETRKPSFQVSSSLLNTNLNDIESHPEDKQSSKIPSFKSPFLKDSTQFKYPELSEIKLDPNVVLKENMNDLMMTEFGINEASNNSFMKKIINVALPKMTQDFRRSYILDQLDFEILNKFGCFSLPNEETCKSYIDNFFEFINPQFPIIDKNNFYETYTDLRNPPSLLLLYSILSVGAWHMSSDSGEPENQFENVEKSQVLFKRAKLLYEYSIEVEPIALIQSVLCFTFHHDNMSNLAKNDYYWTHVAVNLAVQYGFHAQTPPSFSKYFKKIRKRLWWILYLKDRLTAFGYSRPTLINLNDSEHDMLTLEDLTDSGMSYLESLYLLNLIKFGKLIDEIGDIQNEITRLYASGRPIIHLMKKCDLSMITYLENLPKELVFKFSDPSTQSFLSIMLLSHYYTLLTVIHRANIQRHSADIYPSWAISFQAVQMIKFMSDCLVAKKMISKVALLSHNTLTSSCIIMIYHLLNEDKRISKIAKEFFLRVLGIWRSTYRKFPNVYPMLCIFGTIYNSENSLKQIVKSLIPDRQKVEFLKPSSLKLPDLSFIANPNFKISSHDINKTQSTVKFDNLGIDFSKLFTESVFTKGSTYLPKLDLDRLTKNTISRKEEAEKDVKSENVGVKTEPVPLAPIHLVTPNKLGQTAAPILDIHGLSKEQNVDPGSILQSQRSPNLSYIFQEDSRKNMEQQKSSNIINNNNNNLSLPDSIWVMQTDWQPKFLFNGEVSDNSNDTMENIEDPLSANNFAQHYNKSNAFYSDTYNIMGDPNLGPQYQYGYNDNNSGYWNSTTNANKKLPPFVEERFTPSVFDMENNQSNQNPISNQHSNADHIISLHPLQFQTEQQRIIPPPLPNTTSDHHSMERSANGSINYSNLYYRPHVPSNFNDTMPSGFDNGIMHHNVEQQTNKLDINPSVNMSQSASSAQNHYVNNTNRPYFANANQTMYPPTGAGYDNDNQQLLQPQPLQLTNQKHSLHSDIQYSEPTSTFNNIPQLPNTQ